MRRVVEGAVTIESKGGGIRGTRHQLCVDEVAVGVAVVGECSAQCRRRLDGCNCHEVVGHRQILGLCPIERAGTQGNPGLVDTPVDVSTVAVVLRAERCIVGVGIRRRRVRIARRAVQSLCYAIDIDGRAVIGEIDDANYVVPNPRRQRTGSRDDNGAVAVIVCCPR